jgi:hypothetical protein
MKLYEQQSLGSSHWLHEISLPKRVCHHFSPGLTPLANNTPPINVVVVMKGPGLKWGQWEQHNSKGKSFKCGNWVVVLQAKRWWVVVRFQCQAHTHTHTHTLCFPWKICDGWWSLVICLATLTTFLQVHKAHLIVPRPWSYSKWNGYEG